MASTSLVLNPIQSFSWIEEGGFKVFAKTLRDPPSKRNSSSSRPFELQIELLRAFQERIFPVKYSREFYDQLQHPFHFVLVVVQGGNELVGTATFRLQTMETEKNEMKITDSSAKCDNKAMSQLEMKSPVAYIMTLGVAETYRSRGFGKELLLIELDVCCDNIPAMKLYTSQGFVIERKDKCYYYIQGKYYDSYHMKYRVDRSSSRWLRIPMKWRQYWDHSKMMQTIQSLEKEEHRESETSKETLPKATPAYYRDHP